MAQKKNGKPIPVESTKHKDKRVNIPTEELRRFVEEEELAPKTLLYPRDPSLDPQLVWKGKDEQDKEDLAVPTVPVYIQEKIHPQALIEYLRETARAGEAEPELTLFADDFNGIKDFETKVDFYNHEQNWTNRMILGDSLLVMNSLAEKEGLKGKVQMIYIDPPYGIKFGSNWQVSTRKRDVKDGKAEDATRQPEQVKAFRDTWELGIHSYLAYLRDRLVIARELLTETGSVFVQIGDENVHLVRNVMDEVFGSENFVSSISVRKTGGTTGDFLSGTVDFIHWYAREKTRCKFRPLFSERPLEEAYDSGYQNLESPKGDRRRATLDDLPNIKSGDGSRLWLNQILTSPRIRESRSGYFPIEFEGREYLPTSGEWKTNREGIERLKNARRISSNGNSLGYVRFANDFPAVTLTNLWADMWGASNPIYVVQSATRLIERCLLMTTDPGDLVLDPTCGSGTTAYVAEQWGRRWITLDTSRVALALARTRLMAAKYPYYTLSDSPEGVAKGSEVTGKLPSQQKTEGDIRKGFVYKRVPHVTLKSIANNPDIKEGMTREQIDAAIARHADTELLYDQPYEDNKRIRVTGPFTVEGLSPHRRMSIEKKIKLREEGMVGVRMQFIGAGQFALTVIDNLKKAGIQNTIKNERLKFDRLETFSGEWVHAAGEYTEGDKTRRVAVTIGPEFGTVGPELIREAAKEAVQGIGFDTLIVCGFAFDPHVSEEAKKYGKLIVLPTRMNPDLSMGDELLKKTGAANLFMIFGEPDIRPVDKDGKLVPGDDGKIVVEIKGLDIYDPTTGEIRSNTTDDIACWFIDTDYDGESFFVRHAYFTGADQPYERLQKALKAEINEEAWSSLYRTVSRPFEPPSKDHKVAIKVINHYGDEVLKVYEVAGAA